MSNSNDNKLMEQTAEEIRDANFDYLKKFREWSENQELLPETIRNYIREINFYINTYLCDQELQNAREGCYKTSAFFREQTTLSPTKVNHIITSIKNFYQFMLEESEITVGDYNHLNNTMRELKQVWLTGYNKGEYINANEFDENGICRKTGTRFDMNERDKDGYGPDGYNEEGLNRQGHNKVGIFKATGTPYGTDGFNMYDVNEEGTDRKTGEKHDYIVLVEEFLATGKSPHSFCTKKNMHIDVFKQIVEKVVLMYPKITQEQMEQAFERSSEAHKNKRADVFDKLITGKVKIEDYVKDPEATIKFEDLLKQAKIIEEQAQTPEQQDVAIEQTDMLYRMVGTHMASGNMDIMDYFRLFIKGRYDSSGYLALMGPEREPGIAATKSPGIYEEIIDEIRDIPGLNGLILRLHIERKRLEGYRDRKINDSIGYKDTKTGKSHMMVITKEHIEYAQKHIRNSKGYECAKTIENVCLQFAKGTLTFEDIENYVQPETSTLKGLAITKATMQAEADALQKEKTRVEARINENEGALK
ncbi:MAG: hypothetical protein FWC68_02850 [Oscillospiraceae bacterium]|nr:hypothetical protein [Oscillospiraceae bacterium]